MCLPHALNVNVNVDVCNPYAQLYACVVLYLTVLCVFFRAQVRGRLRGGPSRELHPGRQAAAPGGGEHPPAGRGVGPALRRARRAGPQGGGREGMPPPAQRVLTPGDPNAGR